MTNLRPLNAGETAARDSGLDMAARLVGAATRPLCAAQVQALYDVLLAEESGDEPVIALGLAFGELIVSRSNFEWMRIADEYGEETVVAAPGKAIFCAPISMIQKRIEQQERLDLSQLCDDTIAMIRKRIDEGEAADR